MAAKIRVLVVDDSAFMRNMLTRMIERDERFEVVDKATNGQEAIEKVANIKPDVVTLDIEMPVMNGLEALKQIMSRTPVPVVMVSSLTESGARETMEALNSGAVDFIPKALQDKDQNIFHVSEVLHEKLMAAASAKVGVGFSAPASSAHTAAPSVAPAEKPKILAKPVLSAKQLRNPRILVIGSSTGGPRALQEIVPQLPGDLKVPVVIAQHMPPNFTAAMSTRLHEQSPISVQEAADGMVLEPANVYVAPGGLHMRIKKEGEAFVVRIAEDKGESLYRPSVDVLAESVSEICAQNTLAVMLTGMGQDGAKAFSQLHNMGAHVVAQDEESCVVYGMPKAVVDANAADDVLNLSEITKRIVSLLS